jgi:ribonuclease-3
MMAEHIVDNFLEESRFVPLSAQRRAQLEKFCKRLGIHMDRLELLDRGLTHTSFAHETPKVPHNSHNERLEFLGDSVLSLVVSTYLFKKYRKFNEGRMTKLRAQLVCESSLYKCAVELGFGEMLNLGHGEECTGGRTRPSILADAFEAVLGAYYLDQGFEAAQEYLLRFMQQEIDSVCEGQFLWGDYKSRFQELVQGKTDPSNIRYETIGFKGPEHDRVFQAGVFLDDRQLGTGEGRTKKEAEQQAAKEAIASLQAAAQNK